MSELKEIYGTGAIPAERYVNNFVLAADVPELITVPTNATHCVFSSDVDIWVHFLDEDSPADLVTNGDFATDTDFTKGTGWTIAAGVASSDGTQTGDSDLEQTPEFDIEEGQAYYVTFTVSGYSAGNVTPVIGGTEGTDRGADGTFSEVIIAGSGSTLALRADADFVGNADNLSIVPCAQVPAADNTTGNGSVLNPTIRYLGGTDYMSIVAGATAKGSIAYYTKSN